ncbi:MAG: hypothetical protein WCO45_11485 [Pseudanabaena sp. ELA607]|jgi:hypothetical protein
MPLPKMQSPKAEVAKAGAAISEGLSPGVTSIFHGLGINNY